MPWIPTASDGVQDIKTLRSQFETEQAISSLLAEHLAAAEPPSLAVDTHVAYCRRLLDNTLPPYFVGLDASRPWLLYWTIHSLAMMGCEIDEATQTRVTSTLAAFQNESGGFGGGPGQLSHLAPTYAAVCALAYAGPIGWKAIDRTAMHHFLMSLKQPDGSFIMHEGGEVDVRGCYCALTVATLLNILTPELLRGTADFVASCQTYEGGLAAAAQLPADPSQKGSAPLGEAHGGYAFCAVASWAMACDAGQPIETGAGSGRSLDVAALLRWAASMQANPIEGGGFRGRTNKLVDGCYSWWCGGLLPLADHLLAPPSRVPVGAELFDRASLRQYVDFVAQAPGGGLRDKPGKAPDAYHTCYNLSGSSSAQHSPVFSVQRRDRLAASYSPPDTQGDTVSSSPCVKGESATRSAERARLLWSNTLAWESGRPDDTRADRSADLAFAHPLFNVTMPVVWDMMRFFYGQTEVL
ncbi:hypothetical protein JCM8202_004538 [Rhodotorula sphaerocarpa]